jgi:hypothetical protein
MDHLGNKSNFVKNHTNYWNLLIEIMSIFFKE